jgi:hypothetical protein
MEKKDKAEGKSEDRKEGDEQRKDEKCVSLRMKRKRNQKSSKEATTTNDST